MGSIAIPMTTEQWELHSMFQSKVQEKERAEQLATQAFQYFNAHGHDAKKAEKMSGLDGAKAQHQNAKDWMSQMEIFPIKGEWPDIQGINMGGEWRQIMMNQLQKKVPSVKDFYEIAWDHVVDNKKSRAWVTLPTEHYIQGIIDQLTKGEAFYANPSEQNSFKHHCKTNFTYWEPIPHLPGETLVVPGTKLEQRLGTLYKNAGDFKVFFEKWEKAEPGTRKFQAPVTPVNEIRKLWIAAHLEPIINKDGALEFDNAGLPKFHHHGRDATYERLTRGLSSSISKDLVIKLIKCCPTCGDRLETSKEAALRAEPLRAKTRAEKKRAARPDEGEGAVNPRPAKRQRNASVGRQQTPEEPQSGPLLPVEFDEIRALEGQRRSPANRRTDEAEPESFQALNLFELPQQPEEVRPASEVDRPYGDWNHWNIAGQRWPTGAEPTANTTSIEATRTNLVQSNENNANPSQDDARAEQERKDAEAHARQAQKLEDDLRLELGLEKEKEIEASSAVKSSEESQPPKEAPKFRMIGNFALPLGGVTHCQVEISQPIPAEASPEVNVPDDTSSLAPDNDNEQMEASSNTEDLYSSDVEYLFSDDKEVDDAINQLGGHASYTEFLNAY